jgi:hypothetical protein
MPGFSVGGIGYQGFGGQPANTNEFRRAHRWVWRLLGKGQRQFSQPALLLLKSASRPQFKFEQPEVHHNQEVMYLAGKQSYEPVKLEWYDSEQNPDVSAEVYEWLETVVQFNTANVNHPRNYKREAELNMIDGQAQTTEAFRFYGTWPMSVDWKELDMTNIEVLTLSAEMRFDRAIRQCSVNVQPIYAPPMR